MDNRAESKKALVLEAFNTLSISGTTTLPKHSGRPAIQAARKATSTMTIPNSVEVNEVADANRIQSNCSQ
jgi:hypothetical protein